MKYLIDTNVFLRTLVPEDKKSFLECKNIISLIETGSIDAVTASVALAELVWTLKSHYRLKKDEIVLAIKSVAGTKGLEIVDNYDSGLSIDLFEKTNVKFIDCLLASILQLQNKEWGVISYDKDFDKLGVIRKEPEDFRKLLN